MQAPRLSKTNIGIDVLCVRKAGDSAGPIHEKHGWMLLSVE